MGTFISQLPLALAAESDQEIAVEIGGESYKLKVSQIVELITGGAPETLDTLNELADALADDSAFATTVTNLIATKLALSGGTLTGALDMDGQQVQNSVLSDVRSVNGGSLEKWNWIINGDFSVNQRSGTKTPGVGVYGFDRWKGHASGLEQVVENLAAGDYTLSWDGGGTGSVDGETPTSSPALFTVASSGNISVVVPSTADNVSLVSGDAREETTLFTPRPVVVEEQLCRRYYVSDCVGAASGEATASGQTARCFLSINFPETMRAIPTMSYTRVSSGNVNTNPFSGTFQKYTTGFYASPVSTAAGGTYWYGTFTADAEF